MLLRVRDLVAGYGSYEALRKLSLEVAEAEAVTILGANGAGKTTLVKAIVGLLKPKAGLIEFQDKRIDRLPSYQVFKRGISICPEGGNCFPEMSVFKNLMMGALSLKDRAAVKNAYSRAVSLFPILESRRTQKAGSLSGGERQMLAIGRALMGGPKMLLMDEPSLGLAPLVINDIFKAIDRLKVQGLTILLVEQNASKSLKIADRGYVMELGKITISGTSKELSDDERVKDAYLGL
jgi:branched-chain amino acid transport system ATP-binding protein